MNGQVDTGALEEFLRSKGLMGGIPTIRKEFIDMSTPISQRKFQPPSVIKQEKPAPSYAALLVRFLENKGLSIDLPKVPIEDPMMGWKPPAVTKPEAPTREEVAAGVFAPLPAGPEIPTPEERPREIIERPADYVPPPGWWQQIKDVSFLLKSGDLNVYSLVARGLLDNLTLGNIDPVKMVEKISGQEGFAEAYIKEEDRRLKGKLGYVSTVGKKAVLTTAGLVGALVPLTKILKGAGIAAKAATKIPALQALARAELTGVAVGLAAKPEDEGVLNRLKQVPSSVLFFTAFEGLNLTAQQVLKIVRYNRAAKFYKKVDWDAVPDPPGEEVYTAKQMRDLFIKFRRNIDPATKLPEGITPEELKILEHFKTGGGWKEAAKEGWMPPEFAPETGIPAAMPRRPRFTDIFKRPPFAPFEPRPGAPPPAEPPPVRPEALPARPVAVARPEAPPPTERPLERLRGREGVPAVVVDVMPKPEGGWTYNFKIPTGEVTPPPATVIPWKPEAKPLGLPEPKPPVPKEPKAKVFQNPLYEFINYHFKGVKPNPDYPYQALKQVLPFDLIRKDGVAMDVIAQAMKAEFPNIEGDADLMNALEKMADTKAAIKFRDVTTGEELEPPQELFDEQLDRSILDTIEAGKETELSPAETERARELLDMIPPEEAEKLGLDEGMVRIRELMRQRREKADKEMLKRIVEKDVEAAPRIPEEEIAKPPEKIPREKKIEPEKPKEPPRVKEKDLVSALDELNIPAKHRGEVSVSVLKNFDPEKGDLKNYIRKTIATISKRKKPEKVPPLKEEPTPERGPADRFAKAEAEVRIVDAIKKATKNIKEIDIVRSRILDEKSFEEIGKDLKVSRQRAQKVFTTAIDKMKKDPDIIKMLEDRWKEHNMGPMPKWEDMAKSMKKYFTSAKGMSRDVDTANDRRIANPIAEMFLATHEGREIERWIRKNDNAGLRQQVKELLTGERTIHDTVFPENVPAEAIKSLRKRIDDLSTLIIAHGGLKEPTLAAFESGIGKYLGTFYRLHEYNELNKGRLIKKYWDPPQEARDNFAAALRRDDPGAFGDFTKEQMDNFLDAMLRGEDYIYKGSQRTKRVPTDHYKQKKDLSPEWRAFAGEITDPVWLALKTVTKQATMAYNSQFFNTLEDNPQTSILITHDIQTARERAWLGHRLPDDYSYGRLRGAWVHPELDEFIRGEVDPSISGTERAIMKYIMNPFKATKTIYSVPTHARNFSGNPMFSIILRCSIFNPFNSPYYIEFATIWAKRNTTMKNEWAQLIRDGLTETQFFKAEIPAFYNELLKLDPPDWPEKIFNWTIKRGMRAAGELYNFEDVLYRGAAHLKNIKHFKMTPEESVRAINLGSPNYRKVPISIEWLRKYPVLGPFISFRYNVARILSSQSLEAVKELGSKDKKTKAAGAMRLARLLFVLGIPVLLSEVSKKVFDVDDKKVKQLERFYPPYRRGGIVVYFRGKEGQLKGYDFTYTYPPGDFIRALNNLRRGEIDSFTEAMQLFAHPIFDAFSIIIQGRDPYWGTKIEAPFVRRITELIKLLWLPQSAPIPSIQGLIEAMKSGKFWENLRVGKLTTYQIETLIQAFHKQEDRYGRVRKLPEEIKNFFTGIRTWDVDPQALIAQYIKQKQWELTEAERDWKSWERRNTKAAYWQQDEQQRLYEKKRDKIYADIERVGKLLEDMDPTFQLRKIKRK